MAEDPCSSGKISGEERARTAAEPPPAPHPSPAHLAARPLRLQAGGREGGGGIEEDGTNLPPAALEPAEDAVPRRAKPRRRVRSPDPLSGGLAVGSAGGGGRGAARGRADLPARSAPAARTAPAGPSPRSTLRIGQSFPAPAPLGPAPRPYAAWRPRAARGGGRAPAGGSPALGSAGPAPPRAAAFPVRLSERLLRARPSLPLSPPAPSSQPGGHPPPPQTRREIN